MRIGFLHTIFACSLLSSDMQAANEGPETPNLVSSSEMAVFVVIASAILDALKRALTNLEIIFVHGGVPWNMMTSLEMAVFVVIASAIPRPVRATR